MSEGVLLKRVQELMEQNRREVDGHRFTVPSPSSYPYQWLWDSCFHAIILSHFDLSAAKDELRSLVYHQHESGLIGHITYWEKHETILNYDWGLPHTSSLIQPPLLAYAAWRIHEVDDSEAFLEELYPALKAFYTYILNDRILFERGLVGLVNPDESGEDNSPRFDEALSLPTLHDTSENTAKRRKLAEAHKECGFDPACTAKHFWVEDIQFNSLLLWNLHVMADIANTLRKPKDRSFYRSEAVKLASNIKRHMFLDGRFVSLHGEAGTPILSNTSAQFTPLIAELYSLADARVLIHETLMDTDTFWLPHGVPTVAKSDPAYDPAEPTWGEAWQRPHWRGPLWIVTQWLLYRSLKQYGFTVEAEELAKKSVSLIERNGFREYFDPQSGIAMGAHDFTWGGLVLDMQ